MVVGRMGVYGGIVTHHGEQHGGGVVRGGGGGLAADDVGLEEFEVAAEGGEIHSLLEFRGHYFLEGDDLSDWLSYCGGGAADMKTCVDRRGRLEDGGVRVDLVDEALVCEDETMALRGAFRPGHAVETGAQN
jgi:hypothetical protein